MEPWDEWREGEFTIRKYHKDHTPSHVHVFHANSELGRYSLKDDAWLETPDSYRNKATEAVRNWRRKHGY